jgi:dTDP-4-amino-4,6-dideoxygalactose transaminase
MVALDATGSAAPWYYEQLALGYNYRMIDIEAALGLSQLARIDGYVARRNEIAACYGHSLAGLPLQLPTILEGNTSAFHLYVVRLKHEPRERHLGILAGLRDAGVGANLHYLPVHLQPYYRALGFREGQFPEAEAYAASAITLPLYPGLDESSQDKVAGALRELL